MSKRSATFDLNAIGLDGKSSLSLHQQLYTAMRDAILAQRLKAGARLPSTRTFASDLGVSRNTVVSAFDQLLAEGYIESHVGDGTYVSAKLPDDHLNVSSAQQRTTAAGAKRAPAPAAPKLSRRFQAVLNAPMGGNSERITVRAFRTGLAALDHFPTDLWTRLVARHMRHAPAEILSYGSAVGYQPLRVAIAAYLGSTRGVNCEAGQVIITAASQEAINTAAQVLLDDGDEVWMEDPGYQGARSALIGAGARIVPVPIDADGMRVEVGMQRAPNARMAYVTPSYQYPRGVTMSLARRLALLDWAARANAWILEDDYNSEYRYTGRPLAALQGLDKSQRVIYVGTFSKVMFGALRVGYLVLPPQLVDIFGRARTAYHQYLSIIDQAVLTDFIVDGHFARHIRRMREVYKTRRSCLIRSLGQELGHTVEIDCAEAGLHLLAWLKPGVDDVAVSKAAAKLGVEAQALSMYAIEPQPRGGLVLGYGALDERKIRDGVRKLAEAFREVDRK